MRFGRPIPDVALTLFLCAAHFGFASSGQNHTSERDQKIVRIQQLIQDHDLAEAGREILEAMKQYPSDAGFDNLSGIVEAQQGNYTAAEKSFHRALKREPKFTGASLNLGRLYQENSAVDSQARRKALDVYLGVLAYDPKNTEANYQSAALLLEQGKYKDSVDHLSRLPEENQASAQALSILCADYAGLGDRKRTDDAAARLLSDPNFSEPDAQQALLGLRAGKRDDLVISLLESLEKRQPLSTGLLRALGLAYEGMSRLVDARAALERSLTPESLTVGSLFELARVARKQQDYQGSLGYLAHARDLEPNNAGTHYYFGLVCMDLKLVAEARNSFEKAVQIEPENPEYDYAMAVTSTFRHDPGEAVPYFEKYLKLRPQDSRGKLALGAAFFRAKDYARAEKLIRHALAIDPDHYSANFYLLTLYTRTRDARQEAQAKRFDDLKKLLAEKTQEFLRIVEVRPLESP